MAKKIKAKKVIKALRAGQGYAYATKTKIWGDDEAQKVDYGNVGEYFEIFQQLLDENLPPDF